MVFLEPSKVTVTVTVQIILQSFCVYMLLTFYCVRTKEAGLSALVFSYSQLFDKYTGVFSLMFPPMKVAIYTIQMEN